MVFFVVGLTWVYGPSGVLFGVASGALVGALGRMLATAPAESGEPRFRLVLGELAWAFVAVLIGVVLGEMAALAVFVGTLDRELIVQRDTAGAVVTQGCPPAEVLAGLRADRAALDAEVSAATGRRDQALVVARCEYHPGPGCPTTQITGDPGQGPATDQADAELAAARHQLDTVSTRRDQLAPGLDRAIVTARAQLADDAARARELAGADTGLDARWAAMNDRVAGTGLLRAGVDVLFALLMSLALCWWRGQTEQDRRVLARRERNRVEQDADTLVAIHRARQRAALELGNAPTRPQLAASVTSFAEQASQASIPSYDSALRSAEHLGHAETAEVRERPSEAEHDRLPVPVRSREIETAPDRDAAPASPWVPLDLLPGPLPGALRSITGLVRPLIPGPVARLASTGPRSVRLARGLWEEVEELQFTVWRRRTVRMADDQYEQRSKDDQGPPDQPAGGPSSRARVDAQVVSGATPARRRAGCGHARAAQQGSRRRRPGDVGLGPAADARPTTRSTLLLPYCQGNFKRSWRHRFTAKSAGAGAH